MILPNCPGARRFRQPSPEIIKCSSCSAEAEIWTDEVRTTCPKCKNKVTRKTGQNCLDWCKYAKECVGEQVYNKYMKSRDGQKMEGNYG